MVHLNIFNALCDMKSQQKAFLKVISTKLFRFSNVNVDSVYTHYIYKYSIYLYFSSQSVDSIKLSSVPCVFTKRKMTIVIVQIKNRIQQSQFLEKFSNMNLISDFA